MVTSRCDRTRRTVVTHCWAGLCRGYVLFLTVKEVAGGGWSKEVYEVGPPHLCEIGAAPSARSPRHSPCQRFLCNKVCFGDLGSVGKRAELLLSGVAQATSLPLKISQTAAVFEVGIP